MIAELLHRTAYVYDHPVRLGPQLVRLRPRPDPRRPVPGYRLDVEPNPLSQHWQTDTAGNLVARLVLPQPVAALVLTVALELEMTPLNAFDFLVEPEAATWPFRYEPSQADALAAFRHPDHPGTDLEALVAATAIPGETVAFVIGLAAAVRDRLQYLVRMEAGVWTPDHTLAKAAGSCRDSAWLLVQLLRLHGIAARFVSGYLLQVPADDGSDSAELHAWAEAYLPGAGWVGLDATSGLLTAEGHVGLAASADVAGAAPLTGTVEPARVRLETSIAVSPAAVSDAAAIDEMVNGHGGVRPHWRGLLGALSGLDQAVLADRVRRLALAAEEEGAAPNWRCDPIPLLLTAREFTALEQGLAQRARLLEAILADLYGPQRMLAEGMLPPALVHANPAFLRACCGSFPRGPFLQAYAADLMRGPDGQWRVLADRTGGALGIGYARESRRLLARVMPELFRSAQVRQLRPFFEAWQDALLRLGRRPDGRPPVVAMLTPGPADPHWPEHLALSRDLACALVDARDLTVRSGVLSIKTLDGLQPVDVLVRRVPGPTIDPLELMPGGPGVTGLLDAWRNDGAGDGAVQILNHPGAAAIEAPAFAAFMPSLSRNLLGEALLLPTTPTVWLADEGAQRMVAQGFDRWSIRPALDGSTPPAPLNGLSREARAALEQSMAATPWAYAGCTSLLPSRVPCFGSGGLAPRPVVLRLFLMHDGFGWRMMQGGLGRVLAAGEHVTETLPTGALFKDVWVLSEESGVIQGPEPVAQPRVALRRSAGNLPSRVADDFYWLGRYVERLEAQARLARAGLLRRSRGAPLPREIAELQVLVRCLRATGLAIAETGTPIEEQVRMSSQRQGSIGQGLDNAARLIEALRDRMTVETHGAFTHALRAARADVSEAARSAAGIDVMVHAMSGLQRLATTVAGVAAEGMVRGGGRLFLDLGRRIERAMVGGYVLATVLDQPAARLDSTLRMVLELSDSAITYRSRYLSVLQAAPVLDLVLADTGNPRALGFQFQEAAALLEDAGDTELAAVALQWEQRVAGQVDGMTAANDLDAAIPMLCNALVEAGNGAAELSVGITRRFFALLPRLQSVGLETA